MILALIIQNKRGQNQFVVSAHDFPHERAVLQSKLLFNTILRQFKIGKKIDRSFVIDNQLLCVCNVSKEAIFMLIVNRNNLFLGYDGLKKITDFYGRNLRLELPTKKYQETFMMLEEFLQTRELPLSKLNFQFGKPEQQISSKKNPDFEVLNKFGHLSSDVEKSMIANIPIKYAKKAQLIERDLLLVDEFASTSQYEAPKPASNEWIAQARQFNYSSAFKLKSRVIPKEGQNRYQHQVAVQPAKRTDQVQKPQQQYMSISSSDIQLMQQKFRQQGINKQEPNQQPNRPSAPMKTVNLLGQEEMLPQTRSTNPAKPQQQQFNQQAPAQLANDLLDLDYQGKSPSPPKPKSSNGNSTLLPTDLNFQGQSQANLYHMTQLNQQQTQFHGSNHELHQREGVMRTQSSPQKGDDRL